MARTTLTIRVAPVAIDLLRDLATEAEAPQTSRSEIARLVLGEALGNVAVRKAVVERLRANL